MEFPTQGSSSLPSHRALAAARGGSWSRFPALLPAAPGGWSRGLGSAALRWPRGRVPHGGWNQVILTVPSNREHPMTLCTEPQRGGGCRWRNRVLFASFHSHRSHPHLGGRLSQSVCVTDTRTHCESQTMERQKGEKTLPRQKGKWLVHVFKEWSQNQLELPSPKSISVSYGSGSHPLLACSPLTHARNATPGSSQQSQMALGHGLGISILHAHTELPNQHST